VPFLDDVMTTAAAGLEARDHRKAALRKLLAAEAPGVRTPTVKRGLSVDMESTVLRYLAEPYRHELEDRTSLLHRWAGAAGARLVSERSHRSPYLAFRIAMLGLWEQEFDGGSFARSTPSSAVSAGQRARDAE
jgi:hypothetical protein